MSGRYAATLALILCLGAWLRWHNLGTPEQLVFDEVYYVGGARDYLEGRPDSNNVHPPLGKEQIALGMLWFDFGKLKGWWGGPDSLGWRLCSALAGVGTLLATWHLTRTLLTARAALLATLLLSLDFLQIVQSRIAMLDQVQTFWIVSGFAVVAARPPGWGAGSALCFGIATACKWNGLFAAAAAWLAVLLHSRKVPLRLLVSYALGIATVYTLSYLPLFWREGFNLGSLHTIAGYHERMWSFRYDPDQFHHRYLSPFWS